MTTLLKDLSKKYLEEILNFLPVLKVNQEIRFTNSIYWGDPFPYVGLKEQENKWLLIKQLAFEKESSDDQLDQANVYVLVAICEELKKENYTIKQTK